MKLKLCSLDVFLNEIVERKIKVIYYYYEEFEREITFTALDKSLIISYALREMTVTFNKSDEIKKLEEDLPDIKFRNGLLQ